MLGLSLIKKSEKDKLIKAQLDLEYVSLVLEENQSKERKHELERELREHRSKMMVNRLMITMIIIYIILMVYITYKKAYRGF